MAAPATMRPDARNIGPPPQPGSLTTGDLDTFARLGIPLELLAEAHVSRVTDAEARELTGVGRRAGDMAGIVFDYIDPDSNRVVARRLRRDHPEVENDKPKDKYISAYGGLKHLYFPPGANDRLADPDTAIVLVEAEKSALAGTAFAQRTKRKLLFVATGGCNGWRGRVGKMPTPSGHLVDEKGPSADLRLCNNRKVYVLLDANVSTNPKVQQAQRALRIELERRNCEVLVCALPAVDGVNGPDDYIAMRGDEAMANVLDSARPAVASYDYAGGRFELNDKGVYYIETGGDDENPKPPLWVCSPL